MKKVTWTWNTLSIKTLHQASKIGVKFSLDVLQCSMVSQINIGNDLTIVKEICVYGGKYEKEPDERLILQVADS